MDDHNQHLLGVQMMTGRILTAVFGFVMSIAVAPLTMGQSLVATKGDLTFAASYGYSQRHHDGPWVLIDVGYGSDRYGSIQPRKTFHLLTPDGGRIDLPDQREYRAGLNDIRAMSAGAATMQLSPWLALPDCKSEAFVSWDGLPAGAIGRQATLVGRTFAGCRNWVMWGNSGVEWVVTVRSWQHSSPCETPTLELGVGALAGALHRERRGARLTRRDEGEYWAYLTEEQRSQAGCIAARMQRGLSPRADRRRGVVLPVANRHVASGDLHACC